MQSGLSVWLDLRIGLSVIDHKSPCLCPADKRRRPIPGRAATLRCARELLGWQRLSQASSTTSKRTTTSTAHRYGAEAGQPGGGPGCGTRRPEQAGPVRPPPMRSASTPATAHGSAYGN